MGLWSTVGTVAGGVFGGPAGAAIGGGIGGYADEKVAGVPTPPDRSGSGQGADYRDFMDVAYPGTTPWERLGASSPMGAIDSAEISARNARSMQNRELSNRSEIASANNRASVISSLGGVSPMAAKHGLDLLSGGPGSGYDTKTSQDREALASHVRSLDTGSDLNVARKPKEKAFGDVGELISGGISALKAVGKYSPVGFGARVAGDNIDNVRSYIMNDRKRPRRFQ